MKQTAALFSLALLVCHLDRLRFCASLQSISQFNFSWMYFIPYLAPGLIFPELVTDLVQLFI